MANAVVAVFDEYNEAQSAVNELLVAGFAKNEIKLSGKESAPRAKGFFQSLFGKPQEDTDIRLYDEAVKHGNFVVTAIARTDEKSEIASEVMEHHHPIDLDQRSGEWLGTRPEPASREAQTIPVIKEEVKIGKHEVQRGGVRIFTRVTETPIEEDVMLREERVVVERSPADRRASEAELGAFKEGMTELREKAEEPMVSKVARVVEEVRVGKEVTERKQKIKETARKSEVEVERAGTDDYRAHWQEASASQGGQYEEYLPAYQYGATAAGSRQFKGRGWDEVEPDLRRDWETRNPGSKWERFKASVRHAFEKMRG